MGAALGKKIGMRGLSWVEMKHHYAIIPMYVTAFGGNLFALGYLLRLALKNPEVSWSRANPEPWNEYANKQYKLISSGRDYSIGSPAPKYK